jgi:hypothetical protein
VGTTFVNENNDSVATCTEFAQSKARSPDRRVRFPVTVEFYDQRAKVYAPAQNFPFYRVAFKVAGKRLDSRQNETPQHSHLKFLIRKMRRVLFASLAVQF